MAADQGLIDSVANANNKTVAESAAFYAGQAMGNSVQSQNRLQILAESALSTAIKGLQTVTPEQAQADATVTGSSLPALIMQLLSALAGGQIGAKTSDNTPPQTGTQTVAK